uniref:(northern house mosquito) hypothetical protein n=1 Tax=Culex pipiens TaxID=7175 RepID=A0A8D8HX76_CULPI
MLILCCCFLVVIRTSSVRLAKTACCGSSSDSDSTVPPPSRWRRIFRKPNRSSNDELFSAKLGFSELDAPEKKSLAVPQSITHTDVFFQGSPAATVLNVMTVAALDDSVSNSI